MQEILDPTGSRRLLQPHGHFDIFE